MTLAGRNSPLEVRVPMGWGKGQVCKSSFITYRKRRRRREEEEEKKTYM